MRWWFLLMIPGIAACNPRVDQASVQPYEQPAGHPPLGAVAFDQVWGPEHLPDSKDASDAVNPYANVPGSAAAGRVAYGRYCRPCHGPKLDGHSTVGPSLPLGALDLLADGIRDQPDGVLFWKTWNGFGNMPPLGTTMTRREAWQVLVYLRGVHGGDAP